MEDAPIVTNADEFISYLLPADILLFDKLASLNRLVQWGDNRPVGHCGLWKDGGVYEATIKTRATGGAASGVFHTPFTELLDLKVADSRGADVALVRTVTAVRHPEIDDGARLRVLEYAHGFTANASFAAVEAWLLTPFAVERSYSRIDQTLNDVLAGVIRACKFYAGRSLAQRGATDRMFCSELVYRSYENAGLKLEILDPLFARYGRRKRRRNDEYLSDVTRLLDDYEGFFERQVLSLPTGVEETFHMDGMTGHGETGTGGLEAAFAQSRRRSGDPSQSTRGMKARAPEFADMVTPGDLWSSPSLLPVVVLHRPAGH